MPLVEWIRLRPFVNPDTKRNDSANNSNQANSPSQNVPTIVPSLLLNPEPAHEKAALPAKTQVKMQKDVKGYIEEEKRDEGNGALNSSRGLIELAQIHLGTIEE